MCLCIFSLVFCARLTAVSAEIKVKTGFRLTPVITAHKFYAPGVRGQFRRVILFQPKFKSKKKVVLPLCTGPVIFRENRRKFYRFFCQFRAESFFFDQFSWAISLQTDKFSAFLKVKCEIRTNPLYFCEINLKCVLEESQCDKVDTKRRTSVEELGKRSSFQCKVFSTAYRDSCSSHAPKKEKRQRPSKCWQFAKHTSTCSSVQPKMTKFIRWNSGWKQF